MKHYRCGYCGTPTNEQGDTLSLGECNKLTEEQLNNAELVHGYCCYEEQQERFLTVTRDMATDAGDSSLEGERWRW